MKEKKLSSLQQWMQHALISGRSGENAAEAEEYILPSPTLQPAQRLAIYQQGYYARLISCMEGQYKALCHALGEQLFRDFAHEYLNEFPSSSPTLAELGSRFPEFLERNRPDKNDEPREEWIDFMIELARFEWDLYTAFDLPGDEGKSLPLHRSALKVQQCLFLRSYAFPVNRYYSAMAGGSIPDIPPREQTYTAIVRYNYKTSIYPLLESQYFFLTILRSGASIEDTIVKTALQFAATAEKVRNAWNEWSDAWIERGFFIHPE